MPFFKTTIHFPHGGARRSDEVKYRRNAYLIILTLSYRKRNKFMVMSSDLLTDVNAYDECMKVFTSGKDSALRSYCENVSTHNML